MHSLNSLSLLSLVRYLILRCWLGTEDDFICCFWICRHFILLLLWQLRTQPRCQWCWTPCKHLPPLYLAVALGQSLPLSLALSLSLFKRVLSGAEQQYTWDEYRLEWRTHRGLHSHPVWQKTNLFYSLSEIPEVVFAIAMYTQYSSHYQ